VEDDLAFASSRYVADLDVQVRSVKWRSLSLVWQIDYLLESLRMKHEKPNRRTGVMSNLFHAGWKTEPSSLRGRGARLRPWPESRRTCKRIGSGAVIHNLNH
jgi:hypothetical protein